MLVTIGFTFVVMFNVVIVIMIVIIIIVIFGDYTSYYDNIYCKINMLNIQLRRVKIHLFSRLC